LPGYDFVIVLCGTSRNLGCNVVTFGSSLFAVGIEGRQGRYLELRNSGKETEGSSIEPLRTSRAVDTA